MNSKIIKLQCKFNLYRFAKNINIVNKYTYEYRLSAVDRKLLTLLLSKLVGMWLLTL